MKVLLCSPYLQLPDIVPGGINMWANNLLTYRQQIESDIIIEPVSFDRRNYVSVDSSLIKRIYFGLKEFSVAINAANRKMQCGNYDVIHICTSASISLLKDIVLIKLAKKKGVKTVVHFHFGRIPELFLKNNWECKLIKRVIMMADYVVTMDKKSYTALLNHGYANIKYCPNPLSLDIINQIAQQKHIVKRVSNKLLFVGHVLPSKGVYELVDACKRFDNIELHIIGKYEADIKCKLEKIAVDKSNGRWLKFHGEIPHKEVIKEMLSASMFVFPSYTEGFPNVILEAMACETPIVTTNVGAIPEMLDIEHGFNYGICVAPRDADSFAKGLETFILDPNYAKRAASRSFVRVHELYAVPTVWEQLSTIWRNSLN